MRILSVRLCNLNSLAGTWEIDFTAPEYAGSGIFAITGPTGSGKSTLLDAVCLALYGRTPRLGRITKSSNEIMSRRTGVCFAEVDFEAGERRFRCHWSQHRSRKRPGGELQPPKHEIVDSQTDQVLESKLNEVRLLVEQFTGMDFDRFTRSILLAQGGFAAFLQASGDQRAPLLEQITGTEIYSRISIKVHERRNEERERLELLREKIGAVRPMSAEDEQELRQRLAVNKRKADEVQRGLEQVRQAIGWLENIELIQQDLVQLDQEVGDLHVHRTKIEPDLQKLELGIAAGGLEVEFRRFQDSRLRFNQAVARHKELGKEAELLTGEVDRQKKDFDAAEKVSAEVKEHFVKELEVIKAVRDTDIRIAEGKKELSVDKVDLTKASAAVDSSRKLCGQLAGRLGSLEQASLENSNFLENNKPDAVLVEQLGAIRQLVGDLVESHVEIKGIRIQGDSASSSMEALEKKVASKNEQLGVLEEEVNGLQARADSLAEELNQLHEGWQPAGLRKELRKVEERVIGLNNLQTLFDEEQRSKDILGEVAAGLDRLEQKRGELQAEGEKLAEQLVMQEKLVEQLEINQRFSLQVRDYTEARIHLIPGEACPLCGSIEHPWTLDLPDVADVETDLKKEKKVYEQLVAGRARNQEQLTGIGKEQERVNRDRKRGEEQLESIRRQLADLSAEVLGTTVNERVEVEREMLRSGNKLKAAGERVARLDGLEPLLSGAREEVTLKLKIKSDVERDVSETRLHAEAAAREVDRCKEAMAGKEAKFRQRCQELDRQLLPLGVEKFEITEAGELLTDLENRRQMWQEAVDRGRSLKEQQAELQMALAAENSLLERLVKECGEKEAALSERGNQLHRLQENRRQAYGEKDPESEEIRLQSQAQSAEKHCQKLRVKLNDLERRLHVVAEKSTELKKEIDLQSVNLPGEESAFMEKIRKAGFVNQDTYTRALLQEEELFRLKELKKGVEKQEAILTSRRAEKKAALEREQKKQLTEQQVPQLRKELEALAVQLEEHQRRIGADHEKIEHNDGLKQFEQEQQAELEARQQELARWSTLHELIGSADGKKFRVFAQGLTFALMVDHANQQLRKMHDRYILIRDPQKPLELQVIDSYQAGETRSTRNLSGGESFIVSLALSLGLSAMSSRRVRVDSLFLDEGFGTLDEDALDTALQTLSQLHQDGKLIGVISHVPLLKDRILTRIQVRPGANGCSRLVGPGCREI